MAFIQDFLPYFYVPAPRDFTEEHVQPFMDAVNVSWPWKWRACSLTNILALVAVLYGQAGGASNQASTVEL